MPDVPDEVVVLVGRDLRGARLTGCDLSGAVLRGVDVQGVEVEAPWLHEDGGSMVVNGVDVAPLVEAALDVRLPGRGLRRATDPAGLRAAWAALERTWAATLARVEHMPPGSVDVRVAGEWSFAETLRHLVMATDTWLGRGVLGLPLERAYHPLGVPHAEYATDGYDTSLFTTATPSYDEVLAVRAERQAMVREHLAQVSAAELAEPRRNPWAPPDPDGTGERGESVLSCLHVVLQEEWEHLRFAVRDLDVIDAGRA